MLLVPRVLHFLYFASYASYMPFLGVLYSHYDMSNSQIGVLLAIFPLIMLTSPVVTGFADKNNCYKTVVIVQGVFAIASYLALKFCLESGNFWLCASVLVFFAVQIGPTLPIIDGRIIQEIGPRYGLSRLFGSLGYSLISLLLGFMIEATSYDASFLSFSGFYVLLLVCVGLFLPVHKDASHFNQNSASENSEKTISSEEEKSSDVQPGVAPEDSSVSAPRISLPTNDTPSPSPPASDSDENLSSADEGLKPITPCSLPLERREEEEGKKTKPVQADAVEKSFAQRIAILLRMPAFLCYMFTSFVIGFCLSIISGFLFKFLEEDLDAPTRLLGIASAIQPTLELPGFFLGPFLLKHLGIKTMIVLSHLFFMVRFSIYLVLQDPWWTLPVELLHGGAFFLFWTVSMHVVPLLAPPGLASTAIGVFQGVYISLGLGVGYLVCGFIVAAAGYRTLFLSGCIAAALSLVVVFLSYSVIHSAVELKLRQLPLNSLESTVVTSEKAEMVAPYVEP
eukprot:GCRY01001119.1.p1 GENE.GCRY01001119.1~~GCRY01001119.1.p1  ORF type:complete len:509 (+),score=95.08 GCRY01001119.1:207-1733(+)